MINGFLIQNGILERYTLKEKIIQVPQGVVEIGEGACKGCVSIEEVILPESVRKIGKDAFKGCRNLKKINFPSNLVSIGEYAFHRCHCLKEVKLPSSVHHLNHCVFLYCDSLEFVSMPNVTKLGKQVFLNDVHLQILEISPNLDIACICDVFTGCGNIKEIRIANETILSIENAIQALSSSLKAPIVVKEIIKDIFRMMEICDGILVKFQTNLKHVTVPEGITEIAEECFFDKKGILSVKLPSTLKKIGAMAFENCINLETIEFIKEELCISPNAFKNCSSLKHIKISDGKEYIVNGLMDISNQDRPQIIRTIQNQLLSNFLISGTTLLRYHGKEERVVIPEGITIIDEQAFAGKESIDRVILPSSLKEIRQEAFADCLLLQTICFPKGLEWIGESAFENCVKLLRVELPNSIRVIKKSAFNRCVKLKEIQFSEELEEIEDFAFYHCQCLKEVVFPEKIQRIGTMAFYQCACLKHIRLPGSLKELGDNVFTGSAVKSVLIEGQIQQCGTDVFSQCIFLKELTFQEGVKTIGDKFAFQCRSLKNVTLPTTIEYIGKNAFEGSPYLNRAKGNAVNGTIFLDGTNLLGDIMIPEGVTCIAGGAFYGNHKITSVTLPKSLKQIGARAFCNCTLLEEMVLPSGIDRIEEGVFAYCSCLKQVTALGKITQISEKAFYRCEKIEYVPSSKADFIGQEAFFGCSQLNNLTICCSDIQADAFKNTLFLDKLREKMSMVVLSNIVIDGEKCTQKVIIPEGIVKIAPYAFAGNEQITSVVFPKSLVEVGEGAFYGCKNIKNLSFLSELKLIGARAFEKCVQLTEVQVSVHQICQKAFSYCTHLQRVVLQKTHFLGKEAFCECNTLKFFVCEQLEQIGERCFAYCDSLQKFDFTTVKQIEDSAFLGCNSLENIFLEENIKIGSHVFEDCGRLEKISLLGKVEYGSNTFSGCTALKWIESDGKVYTINGYKTLFDRQIPNPIKSIYISAISCFKIEENGVLFEYRNQGRFIQIPKGIKSIEYEVFRNAVNIEEIEIPEEIEYIGARAFHSTIWLEKQKVITPMVIINNILVDASTCYGKVIIPGTVKRVSGWAFANCFGLEEVIFSSEDTIVEEYAFRNCIHLKKVTTSDGKQYFLSDISQRNNSLPPMVKQIFIECLNCFKTNENHVLMECTGNITNLVLINGITAIGEGVFEDSNLLSEITLTEDVVCIGKKAFSFCKWLVKVKNAYSVKRIEKLAFSGCGLLEDIELSDKLEYIGEGAFEHCISLKKILIPEGITEIPERAFYRCKNLKEVWLPSSLKVIGKEAFAFCDALEKVHFPQGLEQVKERAFAWCKNLIDI